MNSIQAQAALASIPMPTLLATYRAQTGDMTSTVSRSKVIQALALVVAKGGLTLDNIRNNGAQAGRASLGRATPAFNPPAAPSRTPTGPDTVAHQAKWDASQATQAAEAARQQAESVRQQAESTARHLEARIDGVARDIGSLASTVSARVTTIDGTIADLGTKISALATDLRKVTRADADQIQTQVAEAVSAALRPVLAVIEERPEIAPQVAQAAATPAMADCDEVFGLDVRDPRGDPLRFAVYAHPEAPAIDGHHLWTERMVRYLALAQATGRNVWLGGPAGTGKTQTVAQFAARTGRMFRRFVFDRLATREDYLGAIGLQQGSTVFQQGPVLDVYTTPGAVCLLDEVGMGNASALSSLNGWLEPGARMAYADRVWHRAQGSMFFACDNSLTQGDQSGRYAGVGQMNVAFADRFSFVVPMHYLDPDQEADAIARHTGCSATLARHVVDALAICRSKVDKGEIIDAPSIRQAIAFVEACRFLPVAEAWQLAILARQPAESSVSLAAVYASAINEALITREI